MLSKSLERSDPTFQTMKMHANTPPADAVKVTEPFLPPKSVDRPVNRPAGTTNHTHIKRPLSGDPELTDQPSTDQTPATFQQLQGPCGAHTMQDNDMDLDSDAEPFYCVNTSYLMYNSLSGQRGPARQTSEKEVLCFHRPGRSNAVHSVYQPASGFDEGKFSDPDPDLTAADTDKALSEEQTYRETVRGSDPSRAGLIYQRWTMPHLLQMIFHSKHPNNSR